MLNSSIWRAVLSLFYPPVIIRGKNGKNSENPVGSNKSEKRKPKSAVYRSFWASVVYFHLRLISTKSHKREMTRNAVSRKASRVRIPNSPPKSPVTKRFSGLFFFVRFRKTASKLPQEQPDFRKELRLFCLFRRIRTVKLGSFRRHINFHSIYCQNSPFRATPFRLPLRLPRTVLTSSQDERKC